MEKNLNKRITLAVFIVLGLVLFVVAIFVIGSKQNLFTPTFDLKAVFETVSGLKEGSSVRFNGINVGSVNHIEIIGANKVAIIMTIDSKVKPFIKIDSKATVISEGLVGNKIVEITSGSNTQPGVKEGDFLETVRPIETEDILKSLKETGENASHMIKDLADIVSKVNQGKGTLGELVNDESLYRHIDSTMMTFMQSTGEVNRLLSTITNSVDVISGDIMGLTPKIKSITSDIAEISRKMNSSESLVGTLLTDTAFANNLKQTIANANRTTAELEKGSFSFAQNMEALKHNFLFKGYFEDIGYWDKTGWEKDIYNKGEQLRLKEQELNEREKKLNELEKQKEDQQKQDTGK
ncbi:MAG: MlaD family protein [Ignavibacteria bacterium]|jgi:phospholipid/cholesterol/gamma-HCH transport system substrate-binding protein